MACARRAGRRARRARFQLTLGVLEYPWPEVVNWDRGLRRRMERVDDRERNGDSEFQDGSRVPHRSPYYEADDFRPVAVISSARRDRDKGI
jgi:hypothetical protein